MQWEILVAAAVPTVAAIWIGHKVQQVHVQLNSRWDEFMAVATARGEVKGREDAHRERGERDSD